VSPGIPVSRRGAAVVLAGPVRSDVSRAILGQHSGDGAYRMILRTRRGFIGGETVATGSMQRRWHGGCGHEAASPFFPRSDIWLDQGACDEAGEGFRSPDLLSTRRVCAGAAGARIAVNTGDLGHGASAAPAGFTSFGLDCTG
jgi:hypothetical protein